LLSYTPEQKGAYSSFAIDVSPAESTKEYSFNGDYLYCTNGEYEARVEVSSLFQLRKDIIYEYSIILPDGEEWSSDTCLDNGECIPVELMMEKCGIKVVFHIPNSILTTPREKGISLVVRNMIYVAVLFVVFTLAMAIYTFSREPFVANKNRKMIDRILSAVTEDFVFLVEVDVKTKIEKVFFVSSGPRPTWFSSGKVKYDENIKSYAEKIVAPEDRNRFLEFTEFNTLMEYFRNNNNEFTIEYDVVLDGERRRYQGKFTFNAQDNDEPKIYVGVRDITKIEEERTEYNRKLMDALAQAEEANKGKSYFLFNMSHDIRTPLNAIIGYSELAKMHLDDKGMLSGYIDKIQICGNQLLGLIGEVLDMAKIESGRLDLIEKPCLCQDLMNDVMIAVNESVEKKGLNFEASGNACHSVILCDKVKVQKILLNIISNAVKYTPKGGNVSLRVTETIRENENLSDFSFVVKDNGIGISKEFLPYVFNSFSRERNATLSGISGTGLGMTITKRLVDAMGGKIEIESEQGKGTTVTVSITFHRLSGEEENKEEMTGDISLENKR
ncbi:MAG: sensor histidine kinase, partial [Candidatus Ornithospirochaeta sp.]